MQAHLYAGTSGPSCPFCGTVLGRMRECSHLQGWRLLHVRLLSPPTLLWVWAEGRTACICVSYTCRQRCRMQRPTSQGLLGRWMWKYADAPNTPECGDWSPPQPAHRLRARSPINPHCCINHNVSTFLWHPSSSLTGLSKFHSSSPPSTSLLSLCPPPLSRSPSSLISDYWRTEILGPKAFYLVH